MNGRKIFEYGMAGICTGLCVPAIYKTYKKLLGDAAKKTSIHIDDLIDIDDFDMDEDDD